MADIMAGPVARVLMPPPEGVRVTSDPLELFNAISVDTKRTESGEYELQITNTRPLGGDYLGEGRPFVVQAGSADLEESERSGIRIEFGVDPVYELVIIAMCSGNEDHRILAEMALYFASASGGVVDFCGALILPRWRATPTVWEGPWAPIQPDFEVWIRSLPGKVLALPYEKTFLKSWLQSPDIHMMK